MSSVGPILTAPARWVARQHGVGHDALVKYIVLSMTLLFWACGSQPRPVTKTTKSVDAPIGGPLSTQLKKTLNKGPAEDDAIVTFAIFTGGAAPLVEDYRSTVDSALRSARIGKRWTPGILVVPTKTELPLDLGTLAQEVGPLGKEIGNASHITFVRYVGRRGPALRHLHAAAAAVSAILGTGVVVDLSVRRAYDRDTWAKWVEAPDWTADQVVPSAQREADGNVVFFSRGMAKLGLPDLELTGVAPEGAREKFAAFQGLLAKLVDRGKAKVGDVIDGGTLKACVRPSEAIENACVAM